MVLFLGELLEELMDELAGWPWWSFNRKRRWVMQGKITVAHRAIRHWETLLHQEDGAEVA